MPILFDVEGDVKPKSVIIRLTESDGTHSKLPFTLKTGSTRIYSEADQFYFQFDKPTSLESVTYYNDVDEEVKDSKRTIETLFETSSWTMPGKQIGGRLDTRFEKFKTSYRYVWSELLVGKDIASVYFKFKQEATSEPEPEPEPEKPKEEPKPEPESPNVKLFADGFCTGDITVYGSSDTLMLEGTSPITLYVPSGPHNKNCCDAKDIDTIWIKTNGKAKVVSVTDEKGESEGWTKSYEQLPYDDVFRTYKDGTDTGIEIPFLYTYLKDLDLPKEIHITLKSDAPVIKPCNVTYQLGNCSSSLESATVTPNKDVSITVNASDGYEFTTTPTIVHNNKTIDFTVSSDKKSASVNFTPTTDFIVSANATKVGGDEPVTQVSRFIDVYLPDSSQLEKIKEIRWITASGSGDSVRGNDINTNISAMYQTFIKIPSNGVKNCKIAGYDTKITIPYTDSVLTDVKSDEVMFEEKYNSAMDYEPHTQCKIYLPFCGIFSIPSNYVIGKTIQLVYSCNLYTCDCECRIYSDHTLVQSESGKFGFEYPFRTIERTNVRVESSNYFSDLVPKIIITRHNFVTLDEHRPISYTAKASEINGYFEADNIQFDIESLAGYTWITKDDVDHIESVLRGGVVNNK